MGKRVFVLCGEASGDLYAGWLIRRLRGLSGDLDVYAMGGRGCYLAGAQVVADPTSIAVVGLWEVLQHLGEFRYIYRTVKEHILDVKPEAIVFVDYPGFNLRLARELRKQLSRTKFFYYISPQLWAWGRERVKLMRMMDRIFVIFPFEVEFYRGYGIDVDFVGHPLGEVLSDLKVDDELGRRLKGEKGLIVLLPGSRMQEIRRHLPVMAEAMKRLKGEFNFCINCAPTIPEFVYNAMLRELGVSVSLVLPDDHATSLSYADMVWVASGTATVQTMFYQKPMIVVYKISPFTYYLLRPLVRVKYISMVNILADELLIPELIQDQFNPDRLIGETKRILSDQEGLERVRKRLSDIGKDLFSVSASTNVAKRILEELSVE